MNDENLARPFINYHILNCQLNFFCFHGNLTFFFYHSISFAASESVVTTVKGG